MAKYVVVQVEKVKDSDGLQRYLGILLPILAKHGGQFIMRGKPGETLMGSWKPKFDTLAVVRFENEDQLNAWFNSEEYQEPKALLKQSADVSLCVFDPIDEA
jgi:uncharacterized protein (DUF1330 family)